MRVLFISHVLDGSGAPRSLLTIIKNLPKEEGVEYFLLALRRDNLEKEFKKILDNKVIIINRKPPKSKILKLIERFVSIPIIAFNILKINPDIIFINSAANSRAIFLSKVFGFKTIVFVHEFDKEFVSLSKIRRKFINLADKVICLSSLHKKWILEEIGFKKEIHIIPNGIDLKEVENLSIDEPDEEFKKFAKDFSFLVANVGFINKRKGWDYFLNIIKGMKDEGKIGFVIIGDFLITNEKEEFLYTLKKEGLERRVYITGLTDNVFKYLKYCHLTAITSRSEVFPMVALESMALGVPVVFFDVGAIKTIFPENYSYKIKPFNIGDYINAILDIKNMSLEEKESIIKTLNERVRQFDAKNVAGQIYEQLKS